MIQPLTLNDGIVNDHFDEIEKAFNRGDSVTYHYYNTDKKKDEVGVPYIQKSNTFKEIYIHNRFCSKDIMSEKTYLKIGRLYV